MSKTLQKTGKFLVFGSILGALLVSSCTNDAAGTDAPVITDSQNLEIALKPDPMEPIIIDDLGPLNVEKKDAAGPNRGRFNISLTYVVPPTERQVEVFEAAAARWERIIIKDVPAVDGPFPSAFQGVPDLEGTVDDVLIEVALAPIDGPGGILGQAGPRFVRTDDFLTITGIMFFDVADLDFLEELDLFEEVIVHEMGHVLGVGTLWNVEPFFERTLIGAVDTNPYFLGRKANVFWNAEGGTNELPVENMGGPGTALGHWRESVLGNELMTGFINLGENPLSRITAGSMRDLGYGSSSVGESYDLPKGAPGVDINELGNEGTAENPGLNIAKMEVLLKPIGFVNSKK